MLPLDNILFQSCSCTWIDWKSKDERKVSWNVGIIICAGPETCCWKLKYSVIMMRSAAVLQESINQEFVNMKVKISQCYIHLKRSLMRGHRCHQWNRPRWPFCHRAVDPEPQTAGQCACQVTGEELATGAGSLPTAKKLASNAACFTSIITLCVVYSIKHSTEEHRTEERLCCSCSSCHISCPMNP